MAQENMELPRQAGDAWLQGALSRLFGYCDAEVVWDTSHFRGWPEAAYHGRAGVERFLSEWLAVWDDYELGVDDVFAAPDGRVVSLIHHSGKGRQSGLPVAKQKAEIEPIRQC